MLIKRTTAAVAMALAFFPRDAAYAGPYGGESLRAETTTATGTGLSRREYSEVIARLEGLRKKLEEWGSVTASAPIIFREAGQFNLDREIAINPTTHELDYTATHFKSTQQHIEDAAKAVSGRAIQSTSTGFGNSMNLEVTPLVRFGVPKPKAPKGAPAKTPATPGTPATPEPPATPETPAPPSPEPKDTLPTAPGEGELTPPDFSLFGEIKADAKTSNDSVDKDLFGKTPEKPAGDLSLTSQQSVILGTNSKITELIMRNMADPPKRQFTNPGKTVHMAIVEVSCNPGWRTRENYVADITASCEYYKSSEAPDRERNRVASAMDGRRPVVFSVLPLIDAQTLELQNSQRQIIDLVTQISAAIPTQAANFRLKDVMKFVKDYKSTVATKTPKTISNSYSAGNTFGFRFMPSLVALKDPAEKGSPSANILQSTVLPVLVTIVVDQGWVHNNGFDSVMVHIANRWLLNDRPPLRTFWKRFTRPMERETTFDRSEIASDVQAASEILEKVFGGVYQRQYISPEIPAQYQMLRRDLTELSAKVFGSSHVVFAFKEPGGRNSPGHPVISSVAPEVVPTGRTTTIAIWGSFFSRPSRVYVGPAEAENVRVSRGGDQILAEVKVPDGAIEQTGRTSVIVESDGGFDTYDKVKVFKPTTPP